MNEKRSILLETGERASLLYSCEEGNLIKICGREPIFFQGRIYEISELEKLENEKRSLNQEIERLKMAVKIEKQVEKAMIKMSQKNLEVAILALLKMSSEEFHRLYKIQHPESPLSNLT